MDWKQWVSSMNILSPLRTTAYLPSMKIVPRLILPEVDEKGHVTVPLLRLHYILLNILLDSLCFFSVLIIREVKYFSGFSYKNTSLFHTCASFSMERKTARQTN